VEASGQWKPSGIRGSPRSGRVSREIPRFAGSILSAVAADMQTSAVLHNLEASVEAQLALAGPSDPGIETVGRAMLAALRPALREAAFELANQAAEEVRAQLPGHRVDLNITEGEPTLRITAEETTMHTPEEEFDARITLRLPPSIKDIVERAASDSGDSVNTWVVKTLAGRAHSNRSSRRRIAETFDI
jgi:HicB family